VATPAASPTAVLRTIDWRFLLPAAPDGRWGRVAVLGGPPGAVARVLSVNLADDATDVMPPAGAADLVVAHASARSDIAAAAEAVAPRGALYLEVDRTRRGARETTPRRVEAALRAAGLTSCAWYAVEPDLGTARAHIPLHLPDAMSWHRRTQFGDRAAFRIADVVRRAAVRALGPDGATLDRPYAVVAVAGDGPPLPGALQDPAVGGCLGASAPAGAVMLTYGGDRALLFPFAAGGREPMGVVKVPKTASLAARTEHEQAEMRALRSTLAPTLAAAIPEPLGIVRAAGSLVACERYQSGVTIASRATDRARSLDDKRDDLRLAMGWLARFHRATITRSGALADVRGEAIDALLDAYARELGSDGTPALATHAGDAAASLGSARVVIGGQHRDFAAWNVLLDGSSIAVVDWEGGSVGLSACDAVHLATTWLYMVRLGDGVDDELRCARELFVPRLDRDAAAAAAWNAFMWYLDELALDRRLASLLVAVHRLELTLRRVAQRRLQGEGDAARESDEARIVRALGADAPDAFAHDGTPP
jgi:hypothetical protein